MQFWCPARRSFNRGNPRTGLVLPRRPAPSCRLLTADVVIPLSMYVGPQTLATLRDASQLPPA
jgi:hypothetical protein